MSLFADSATLTQDLTKNRDEAGEAIDQYVSRGGTALYDALGLGLERLRRVEGRRALVVLTDGRDENDAGTAPGSVRPFNDVLRLAQEIDVTVFAIGLGANVDRERLEALATTTGGLALFPNDVVGLEGEYQRIVENLRRRYMVAYTSTNARRNGGWRNVTIESQTPHTIVRSRGGYYAPNDEHVKLRPLLATAPVTFDQGPRELNAACGPRAAMSADAGTRDHPSIAVARRRRPSSRRSPTPPARGPVAPPARRRQSSGDQAAARRRHGDLVQGTREPHSVQQTTIEHQRDAPRASTLR